jgi:type IV pilus assembly protein PilB
MNPKQTIDLLIDQGVVDASRSDEFLDEINSTGKSIQEVLVNSGLVNETQFFEVLAQALGTEYFDLSSFEPTEPVLRLVPGKLARVHGAIPLGVENDAVVVALTDPLNTQIAEDLRFALGHNIHAVVAPTRQIEEMITRYYGAETANDDDALADLDAAAIAFGEDAAADMKSVEAEANATPIIRYVDLIIAQAVQDRASDIHFEPFDRDFKIRYRVDGALYEMTPPPYHLALPIISRVKVMANLNIAERRLPQDGRIQKILGGRQVDLRVSTLPTQFGESVVLRVLDRSNVNLELDGLGLPGFVLDFINEIIQKPNGIFIVTGPTGSGKTTTLYACLNKINTVDSKLLTAEDPVEYDIEGIIQVPINENIGLTFGRVLRAFLRQDPDRIMVGETRDLETAQIAIQASLTGHLVFSTLHTNDAPGAVTRLVDMGLEPFLLSASLEAVLAQRLIRRICPDCRTSYEPTESVLSQLGLGPHEIGDKHFFYGRGCEKCSNTGYRGRKGIFELLAINDPLRELINKRSPAVVIRQKAIELGMTTLRQDGLRSIFDGETTIEEVIKYT